MAGTNTIVIGKTIYTFTTMGLNATQTVVVARAVPVFAWREATLLARLHSGTLTSTQKIDVVAWIAANIDEDPNTDFVYNYGSTPAAKVSFTSSSVAPGAWQDSVKFGGNPYGFGEYLRIELNVTQAAANTSFVAGLSIDLSLKA